jgi:ubiquinone/menaquinone biosynthesis C-methylase UbiE
MIYEVMDVRKMSYPDRHFDMVLDKSTIDALCCSETLAIDVAMMLKEVYRVLKENGLYFVVSYARP